MPTDLFQGSEQFLLPLAFGQTALQNIGAALRPGVIRPADPFGPLVTLSLIQQRQESQLGQEERIKELERRRRGSALLARQMGLPPEFADVPSEQLIALQRQPHGNVLQAAFGDVGQAVPQQAPLFPRGPAVTPPQQPGTFAPPAAPPVGPPAAPAETTLPPITPLMRGRGGITVMEPGASVQITPERETELWLSQVYAAGSRPSKAIDELVKQGVPISPAIAQLGARDEIARQLEENPNLVISNPRGLIGAVTRSYPGVNPLELGQQLYQMTLMGLSSLVQETYPDVPANIQFRMAFDGANSLMFPFVSPTNEQRREAMTVPPLTQLEAEAVQRGDTKTQQAIFDFTRSIEASRTAGQVETRKQLEPLSPTELQKFPGPPPAGTTMGQLEGGKPPARPFSRPQEIQQEILERERSQRQASVEPIAKNIQEIVKIGTRFQQEFHDAGVLESGAILLDVLNPVPQTKAGKTYSVYDRLVQTNRAATARAVQAQVGNLTETEQIVAAQGFPTLIEILNNPAGANERLAVLERVMQLQLRDPSFMMPRFSTEKGALQTNITPPGGEDVYTRILEEIRAKRKAQ